MTFHDVRFPEDISYGSSGGPEFHTDVVVLASGHEQRNSNWAEARARYNVAHGVKTRSQLDALIAFFRARKGRAHGFRFKDWSDFQAQGETLGIGDNTVLEFACVKRYQSGGVIAVRPVRKLVSGSLTIYADGVVQASGFTADLNQGTIAFASPPAAGVVITADFEFDVPVRFDTDRLSATLDAYGSHSWLDIPLVEIRL